MVGRAPSSARESPGHLGGQNSTAARRDNVGPTCLRSNHEDPSRATHCNEGDLLLRRNRSDYQREILDPIRGRTFRSVARASLSAWIRGERSVARNQPGLPVRVGGLL